MTAATVTVFVGGGQRRDVTAYPTPVPGLVINRDPYSDDLFNVTHAASGAAVMARIPDPELALDLAMRLADIADWTLPATVILKSGARDRWLEILAETDPGYSVGRAVPVRMLASVEGCAS